MSLSLYASFFNIQSAGFSWRDTLRNWHSFLNEGDDEIVIAVNTSTDNTAQLLRDFAQQLFYEKPLSRVRIKVVECAIPYDDPEFDGKCKAFALSHCSQPYAMLLDADEVLIPGQKKLWLGLVQELQNNYSFDGILIPVVDIFHDEQHYKSIGSKWYLHRNTPNITRGVVKWAYREDGSIDISKSDSCEAVYADSRELIRATPLLMPLPHFLQIAQLEAGDTPFVVHLGYLDKQKRLSQDAFWQPVWQNRDKSEVKTAKSLDELDKIPYYPHRLPSWKVEQ